MEQPQGTVIGQVDVRSVSRTKISVRTGVVTDAGAPFEYISHDLSAAGMRLCGVPGSGLEVDAAVAVEIHVVGVVVSIRGRVVRIDETDGRPDYAIQFTSEPERYEPEIERIVEGESPVPPSVLLVGRSEADWKWLGSAASHCGLASGPREVLSRLEDHVFEAGVLRPDLSWQIDGWVDRYPDVAWRVMDGRGRLLSGAPVVASSAPEAASDR